MSRLPGTGSSTSRTTRLTIGALLSLAGCAGDLDPPWQLDHDRIIAVRATPPAIVAGEQARIDGLIAVAGSTTIEGPPDVAYVVAPTRFADRLAQVGADWIVTAPEDSELAVAREELGIAADEPVLLQLGVSFAQQTLSGLKTVALGASRPNPTLPVTRIDDSPTPAAGDEIVIGSGVDVRLAIEALDTDDVNWLTSCGEMHDFDLPRAYLRVEPDSPTEGELVVVLRDERGGVVWQRWPIRAE